MLNDPSVLNDLSITQTTEHATQHSKLRAWLVSVMLVLLALVNWGDKAVLGLVAVPLMEDLNISASQYGLLASAIYFFFSASAVGAGFLANRLSVRLLLLIMVAVWSVFQFTIWLAPTFGIILLSRILLGLGEGPSAGLSFHAASKWFRDEERNLPIALQNVGAFGGIAVAAPMITWIIGNYNWRWAFFAVGAAGLIWIVAWYFIGKDGPYSGESKSPNSGSIFDGPVRIPYRQLLLSRTFIGSVCIGLAAYWALAIVSAWLPAYLRNAEGLTAQDAANLVMSVSLTAIFFLIAEAMATQKLMQRGLSTRFARGWMASGSVVVSGVSIIISVMMAPSFAQDVALCIGFGLCLVTFTTGATLIAEFVPVLQRGAAMGIYVAALTSAGIVCPTVFGWFVDLGGPDGSGYTLALMISGVLVLSGGIAGFALVDPPREAARLVELVEPAT